MTNRENNLWIKLYIYRWKDLVYELLIDFMKSFPKCMGIVVGGERPPCPGYYLYLWKPAVGGGRHNWHVGPFARSYCKC
jgi:hypothetical protein